jgi:glycosyltransferase involved in cell wall biosynthesis
MVQRKFLTTVTDNFRGNELVIAMFANTAWSIYNFRLGLIRALQAEGNTILVVVPPDKKYVGLLQKIGCEVTVTPMDNMGTNLLRDGMLFLRYLQYIYKAKPDLCILFTIKPVIYGSIASWINRTPSISVITGLGTAFLADNFLTRVVENLYRLALSCSNRVFFLNSEDKHLFCSKGIIQDSKFITTIPGEGVDLNVFKKEGIETIIRKNVTRVCVFPGLSIERFKSDHNDGFSFILVARMIRDKGVVEFVDAARILKQQFPAVKFKLLGYIGVQNRGAISQKEIDNWVREGVVEYLGSASDVRPFLKNSDCVVLPSYREGISRTLLEAAAMSLPIITTNVPGCRDVVEDGVNGFLCASHSAHDLADKLKILLGLNAEQRFEMGRRGREKVECEFDERIVIEKYREAILSIFE